MALTNKQKDKLLNLQNKIMEMQEELASYMEDVERDSADLLGGAGILLG